jgi:integrase
VLVRPNFDHLSLERNVAASTQNQAVSSILFFFQRVLERKAGDFGEAIRARRGRKLPVVMSKEEVGRLLAATGGTTGLILRLLYGAGLRLAECLKLRVKDPDFDRQQIVIRDGKGAKVETGCRKSVTFGGFGKRHLNFSKGFKLL